MRITHLSSFTALLGLVCLVMPVFAIQSNLAGIVDWHKPLIGQPLLEPTPPSVIDTASGRKVVSITKSNVVAVLNAESGDIGLSPFLELDRC